MRRRKARSRQDQKYSSVQHELDDTDKGRNVKHEFAELSGDREPVEMDGESVPRKQAVVIPSQRAKDAPGAYP